MKCMLLSPAGSPEALYGAVGSGADAVYFGGEVFNARRNAKNFSYEQMKECIDYCHLYGVLVFITVNILIKEKELDELSEYAKKLCELKVDGVIVQDLGVLNVFKQIAPDLNVHASTQVSATSDYDVLWLENVGFVTTVLARELSENEIKTICENSNSNIEVFVHGALCMCYSGRCLFSSILGGRSGNRGLCAQPCRLEYSLLENGKSVKSGYLLSPKDLCLLDKADKLNKSGVKYLKIEGRLKRPEYVSTVTGIYRKYIDNPKTVSKEDMEKLRNAFMRGFTHGFYGGETGECMMSFKNSSNIAKNIFSENAKKCCFKESYYRKIPISIRCIAKIGKPLYIAFEDDIKNTVTVKSDECIEYAINNPTTQERITSQLSKLGSTPYECSNLDIEADENINIKVSVINNLRRLAVDALNEKRIERKEIKTSNYIKPDNFNRKKKKPILTADVISLDQAKTCVKCGIKRIFIPKELQNKFDYKDSEIVVKAAEVTKNDILAIQSDKVCISSYGELEKYKDKTLFGDYSLNITNSKSLFYLKNLKSVTISPELNCREIKDIIEHTDVLTEVIVYGRLNLSIMQNCTIKACGKCQNRRNIYSLRDRKNEEFPLICSENCMLRIINSKPIYLSDKLKSIIDTQVDFLKLLFTVEEKEECSRIIEQYQNAIDGQKGLEMEQNTFTRGHYFRGIE